VVCSVLFLVAMYHAARRYVPRISSTWVVAALAVNPFVLDSASNLRTYSFVLLLSALLLLFFEMGFLRKADTAAARAAFLITAVAALYTQYYLGFLLVGFAVALFCLRKWRTLGGYLVLMMVAGVCFAPMVFVVPSQVRQHTGGIVETVSLRHALLFIPVRIQQYLWPVRDSWSFGVRWGIWLALYVSLLALAALVIRRLDRRVWSLGIAAAVSAGFIFAVMVAVTGRELMGMRHSALLLPVSILTVYGLFAALPRGRVLALGAWTAVVLCLSGVVLIDVHTPYARPGDYARVAAYLERHETADEPIVVYTAEAEMPLAYYYHGKNQLVALPKPENFDRYNVRELLLHDENQVAQALEKWAAKAPQFWVVTNCAPGDRAWLGVRFNVEVLDQYLAEHTRVVSEQAFFGSLVRLCAWKTAAPRQPAGASPTPSEPAAVSGGATP
jgi:hypothetical protein